MRFKTIRRQPPVKGGRVPRHSGLIPELDRRVNREAARYGVTRSFVIATCIKFASGIEEQPDYRQARSKSGADFEKKKAS